MYGGSQGGIGGGVWRKGGIVAAGWALWGTGSGVVVVAWLPLLVALVVLAVLVCAAVVAVVAAVEAAVVVAMAVVV